MSFEWYGRTNEETGTPRELVWKQQITRYRFIVGEEVMSIDRSNNPCVELRIGAELRLNKSEAKKFVTKGYVEYGVSMWDAQRNQWVRNQYRITQGSLRKDVEYRELKQMSVDPAEFVTPKKPKKGKS